MTFEDDRPEERQEGAEPEAAGEPEAATEPEGSSEPEGSPEPQATPEPDESADDASEGDGPAADADQEQERAPEEPRRGQRRQPAESGEGEQPDVVPGADLEPDLVLDEPAPQQGDEYSDAAYAERYAEPEGETAEEPAARPDEGPARERATSARTPMEIAADARYQATGKRKTSVARVILKPGSGTYTVNGRTLEQFFPRHGLQATARQPLSAAGYESRMDVVARLHGGGVSSQAGALRHGVARALVEADPSLREDLKRRGYLTRDPRAKERKKAGLKKARKRPQFSKR
jgi:small subunit ribosomal protein S9